MPEQDPVSTIQVAATLGKARQAAAAIINDFEQGNYFGKILVVLQYRVSFSGGEIVSINSGDGEVSSVKYRVLFHFVAPYLGLVKMWPRPKIGTRAGLVNSLRIIFLAYRYRQAGLFALQASTILTGGTYESVQGSGYQHGRV